MQSRPRSTTKDCLLIATSDLRDALVEGVREIDSEAGPARVGSEDYYDQLATAIVAYVHAEVRADHASTHLRDLIKNIEATALLRAEAFNVLT